MTPALARMSRNRTFQVGVRPHHRATRLQTAEIGVDYGMDENGAMEIHLTYAPENIG